LLQVQDRLLLEYGLVSEVSIAGATDQDPAYAERMRALIGAGVRSARLLGEISEGELDRMYERAHFFLFLNVDQSWGLAVFEAMSRGVPTIVSSSVGATELLHPGDDAIVVDPMDVQGISREIATVWRDPLRWQMLSVRGRDAVKAMSWDAMYSSRVEKLFTTVLAPR
jgi:glycosyltransferase involved in cell wall biosynthesis